METIRDESDRPNSISWKRGNRTRGSEERKVSKREREGARRRPRDLLTEEQLYEEEDRVYHQQSDDTSFSRQSHREKMSRGGKRREGGERERELWVQVNLKAQRKGQVATRIWPDRIKTFFYLIGEDGRILLGSRVN